MSTLTNNRNQKLREFEKASFSRFCLKHGYDEREYSEMIMDVVKSRVAASIADIDLRKLTDPWIRKHIETMQRATDYISMREQDNLASLRLYTQMISNHFRNLPINMHYVAALSKTLRLKEESDEAVATIKLIEAVPLISNWDLEFNAFVTGESEFDGLPGVCIYEVLLTSCQAFTSFVVPAVFDFEGRTAKLADTKKLELVANNAEFVDRLTGCLQFLLCEDADRRLAGEIGSYALQRILDLITTGSAGMVWLHEFGHLLQGHLRMPESHQIEFDADRFAFTLYAYEASTQPHGIWYFFGALATVFLLDILETVHRAKESKSHPLARSRMRAALEVLMEIAPAWEYTAYAYVCCLATVVNPTLQKRWAVSIDYSR